MSISKKKLDANRRNAQKSSGPQCAATKAITSQNARKHGLTGTFRVQPDESQEMYERVLDEYVRVEKPADEVELQLIRKMVESNWISARAVRCQEGCFLDQSTPELLKKGFSSCKISAQLERFLRYQAAADRAYARAAAELAKHRKERLAAERGFVSQKHAEELLALRKKQQQQRDDLHSYKVMTARLRLDPMLERVLEGRDFSSPPKTRQNAA